MGRLDFGEEGKGKRKGKGKGREGLIFFPRGREGGGELKRERRLDFFPADLKHVFSLLLLNSLT